MSTNPERTVTIAMTVRTRHEVDDLSMDIARWALNEAMPVLRLDISEGAPSAPVVPAPPAKTVGLARENHLWITTLPFVYCPECYFNVSCENMPGDLKRGGLVEMYCFNDKCSRKGKRMLVPIAKIEVEEVKG